MDLKPPVNVSNSHIVRKAEQHAYMVTTRKPMKGDESGTTADAKPPGWRAQVGCLKCLELGTCGNGNHYTVQNEHSS